MGGMYSMQTHCHGLESIGLASLHWRDGSDMPFFGGAPGCLRFTRMVLDTVTVKRTFGKEKYHSFVCWLKEATFEKFEVYLPPCALSVFGSHDCEPRGLPESSTVHGCTGVVAINGVKFRSTGACSCTAIVTTPTRGRERTIPTLFFVISEKRRARMQWSLL